MIESLEKLELYKKAKTLRKDLVKLARTFPAEERFRLTDQLIRAARSITANIAEGYGRYHYQENIQYCRQSRGSLLESYDHLTAAIEEGYIINEIFNTHTCQLKEIIGLLNGYVIYLKKRKTGDNSTS